MTKELPGGGNASLAAPVLPRPRGVAALKPPHEAQRSRARALPRVGGNGLHKAPPAQAPGGFALGHCGVRAPREPSAHPHGSSSGREEKKQQPPDRSGRTMGCWSPSRFPNCKQPATEMTLLVERSQQAPRPGSEGASPQERLRPPSIGRRSTNC